MEFSFFAILENIGFGDLFIQWINTIYNEPMASEIQKNYMKLTKMCNDLKCWNTLPLSLIERIETVQMKILPKIIYFQCEPPSKWFQSLNSVISGFYWKNKS